MTALPAGANAVPEKWHGYGAVIMGHYHSDSTMTVWPSCDVSVFESADVSVS